MSRLASLAKPHSSPTYTTAVQPAIRCAHTYSIRHSPYHKLCSSYFDDTEFQAAAAGWQRSSLGHKALVWSTRLIVQHGNYPIANHQQPYRDSHTRRSLHRKPQTCPSVFVRRLSSRHGRHLSASGAALAQAPTDLSREEYKDLVNIYPKHHPSDLTPEEKAARKAKHASLAPRLFLTAEQEDGYTPEKRRLVQPEAREQKRALWKLRTLLASGLGRVPHGRLWRAFEGLQKPRLRYLADDEVHRLFRHMAWTQYKSEPEVMKRYFDLIDECFGERVPLTADIWNTAISFAGRWLRTIGDTEVKRMVETWMRMEQAGYKATNVTFNILFDVAVKAGRFALADTVYNELKMRELPLSRHFRTSLISYAGTRHDGDAVRQAFRDLVNASEIVDTTVMNCVISALVQAGEAPAAEHVFGRMKRLHEQKFGSAAPSDWIGQRELGNLLAKTGRMLRRQQKEHQLSFFGGTYSTDDKREEIQKLTPIAPNARTYQILIRHHASTSGNIARIQELVAELREAGLTLSGSSYVHILRGFWQHAGTPYSRWDRDALENLWTGLIAALKVGKEGKPALKIFPDDRFDLLGAMIAEAEQIADRAGRDVEVEAEIEVTDADGLDPIPIHQRAPSFDNALAFAAIRAFDKCSGRRRMLDVWDEMQQRWHDMTELQRMQLQGLVDELVRQDSEYFL